MKTPAHLAVATLEAFRRKPAGRYVAGRSGAHFCVTPALWGVVLWGRPSEADALELGRSLVLELDERTPPHASIVDASRLEGGDEGAFGQLQRYLTTRSEELRAAVTRLALIRPGGLRGAVVAGAYEVVPRPYPVAIFGELGQGLEWLEAPAAQPAIEGMIREVLGTSPVLTALRGYLDTKLDGASLASSAHALKTSERSLQRHLGDAGVTFRDELADARVRAAQSRLRDSDSPLTTIALEVGCASLQNFNALFRRRTGLSPSAWRARVRAAR